MRFSASVLSGLLLASVWHGAALAAETPVVVAAENTWGDLAAQVAEPDMHVTAILNTPTLDPHLYEPTPAAARLVAQASLLVANGGGYDAWLDKLAQARGGQAVPMIKADGWTGWHTGDNAHLAYNLPAVASFVSRFVAACQAVDPEHASAYDARGKTVLAAVQNVLEHMDTLREKVRGEPVAATEPVFTPLAEGLGLVMKEQAFQVAVMNDVEPPASAVAQFDADIRQHAVRFVAYNAQADRPSVQRLIAQAQAAGVPVLPVHELMPPGTHWQDWMHTTLTQVAQALGQTAP
ncbi:metal ABC transporter solute-binding protein, Zn/Mn family [Acetobacter orleanensis]|uniref:ABC transporter substrate-binding protein n=1 Tax=Acetobacter orleanensis TaxID=104099 RepID=A0A4Y3TLS9_9PROT|nr:zinc ABC transporter substrate-binding protein [Acetobacter orleanensis]KXV65404.1 zinc ABC transporter substrate-binding protein [Acetobacter orleanensis]PCD80118.1 zinc ABC transporter substrate-binding protein [Acetobacter orleanensis]GAN68462.1 ABC transporter Mn2+/Zn2+ permease [Acetobacter orleanensis JCM 7639]GBR22831.1 Mn2+/Zn2+ transporter substrate-binding periplasmic protein [Acetobacter orleanensis NRIC 0473]GEB82693.1 ABC transporter substrate-binding protein [Acetobacter orlea